MPVIGHQLKRKQRDLIAFQPFGEDLLESFVIRLLAKNLSAGIATVQRMLQPASFIRSWSSWHANNLPHTPPQINES
jgi:hypothetical protein